MSGSDDMNFDPYNQAHGNAGNIDSRGYTGGDGGNSNVRLRADSDLQTKVQSLKQTPKVGSRARVVLEGRVRSFNHKDRGFLIGESPQGNWIDLDASHVVSVEVLPPPVVTFKPGQIVRGKGGDQTFALGKGGYLDLAEGRWYLSKHVFTTKDHELVPIPGSEL